VRDAADALVRSVSGSGTAVETTWSGRDNDGRIVPDGDYALTLSAGDAHGETRPATAVVRVDTTPPQLQGASVEPDPFSPNGDDQDDVATVSFQPGESGTARVTVRDDDDQVVRTLLAWRSIGAARKSVRWDGRVNEDGKLVDAPEGKMVIVVEMRDLAGNSDAVRRSVTVDRTLGFPAVTPAAFSPNGDGVKDAVSLAFKLTRRAAVMVRVLKSEETARVIDLGILGAGDHEAAWDGAPGGGGAPASGAYRLKVVADGRHGISSVSVPVTVDLTAPKLTVPASVAAKAGKTAKVSYTVRDAFSGTVKVTVAVTDAAGAQLATLSQGWVKQGAGATASWKAPAPGTYTLTFSAADRSGNAPKVPAVTVLTVR
jgi:hypothetical protein